MSVLIKGMEMPTSCDNCFLPLRYCPYAMKPNGSCPLVEIPPHGRLIDADALMEVNAELADCDFIHPRIGSTLREVIEDAPTIIEAEGEE